MATRKKTSPRALAAAPDDQAPAAPTAPALPLPPAETPIAVPPVVAMVASAGGLEAFKRFFQAMPPDSGLAFLLIPHLDPRRDSLMPQLLSKYTEMPVSEAAEGERVAPNRVYVVAPDHCLSTEHGLLRLTGPVDSMQTAIDASLRAIAADQQERAACIVLSGTGSHGTLGLKAIKAGGGLTLVQDPGTAAYPQMPQSAMATELADAVLPVEQMAEPLLRFARYLATDPIPPAGPDSVDDELKQIVTLLRTRATIDFTHYRKGTLRRRVQRRMALARLEGLADYLTLLRGQPDELQALAKDLLISVTSFFRDAEMFSFLEAHAIPELLRHKAANAPVRVWVAGCATGEEAYSIAMLLQEQMAAARLSGVLQVFASDIDGAALEIARRGIYPATIAADVSPARLAHFFSRVDDDRVQVSKPLRDTVLFTLQNVLSDAPFSRLDLLSCRNLLIYLETEVQDKLIALLHFALADGGVLVLGPSESLGRRAGMFVPLSKKWRVLRRSAAGRYEHVAIPISGPAAGPRPAAAAPVERAPSWADLTRGLLVEDFAPAAVLARPDYEVLHFSGATDQYLRQPAGAPTRDLSLLARDELRSLIRVAMHKALRGGKRIHVDGGTIERNGRQVPVRVSARPVQAEAGALLLVSFEQQGKGEPVRRSAAAAPPDERSLVRQLEQELKRSRQALQSTNEELESSNEELKAANEEMMSMNEEVQTANEELETSKEELQSINEELTVVNNQLQEKVSQLESTGNDIANLLTSTGVAAVFLAVDQRIRSFTPAASRLFNLIAGDIGRPLEDITRRFTDPNLQSELALVLKTHGTHEAEVPTVDGGGWYLRRIAPYRTWDNRIDGAVLVFFDVSALKRAEQELRALSALLEQRVAQRGVELQVRGGQLDRAQEDLHGEQRLVSAVMQSSGLLLAVLDSQGRVVRCNPACEAYAGRSGAALMGQLFSDVVTPAAQRARCVEWLAAVAAGDSPLAWEYARTRRGAPQRRVSWLGSRFAGDDGQTEYLIAAGFDVTERRRAEEELGERRDQVAHLHRLHTAGELTAALAHELNQPLAAVAGYADAAMQRLAQGEQAASAFLGDFEQIASQAHRAARSISDIRRFLAKDQGLLALPCDLNQVVRAARKLMLADTRRREVEIALDLADGLPPVLAEEIQIEHVLANLIANAMDAVSDHRDAGGEVRIITRAPSAARVQVSVCDNGPGIGAGEAERIFNAFHTSKAQGLGIGLSISRTIVEAHGGKLWVEPGGDGGIFHFTLPLAH